MNFATLFGRKAAYANPPAASTSHLDLFLIKTGLGNWLGVAQNGEAEMLPFTTPETALIAVIPRRAPQHSFLIAPDGRHITVEGDGFTAPAISARLRRIPGGRVEFRHPIATNRHLGVMTGVPVGKPQRVLFDRVGDKTLDRFELHPVTTETLSTFGQVLLQELAVALDGPLTTPRLLPLLYATTLRPDLAEALIRSLLPDELEALAARLLATPPDLALLRRAIPHDPWVNTTLPALIDWLAQDRPPTKRAHSPAADDHVAVLQTGDLRPQAGLALLSLARRQIPPSRGACLLATARNEGPYILDWLAHHRAAGFQHAIIYSNDNDDGSDELLGLLADHGEITWVRNDLSPTARSQWKAYGHAFKSLPDILDFRWTMVLDLDEYVGFRTDMFATIDDFLGWQEHQPTDSVAMRWLHFAAGRLDLWHDAPSTRRFTRREPEISKLFKSIVRSNQFWHAHAHFPFPTMDAPFTYRLEDGSINHHMGLLKGIKIPTDTVSADTAWIAHHVYRTAGESLIKATRGDCTWSAQSRADTEFLDTIVKRWVTMADNPNLVTDDRTPHTARTLDAHLTRLRGLPQIRACDDSIKHRFSTRMSAVTQAFLETPVSPDRPKEYTQFQNILRRQAEHRRATAA